MKKLAVIVGRFQTYSIREHLGNSEILIKETLKVADKILFIIRCSLIDDSSIIMNEDDFCFLLGINERNPLNFDSRRIMLLQYFSEENLTDRLFGIYPLYDVNSDELWSHNLDQIILSNKSSLNINNEDLVLIGSRDSFLKNYTGIFNIISLESNVNFSSTQMRENIKHNFENKSFQIGFRISQNLRTYYKLILPDEDSRRGYIYGIFHKELMK